VVELYRVRHIINVVHHFAYVTRSGPETDVKPKRPASSLTVTRSALAFPHAALFCLTVLSASLLFSPGAAAATCADEISKLVSKDTERMLTQYNRVTRRIEREGSSPGLRAEECRIAKQLEPQLASQVEALKHSRCRRDPSVSNMLADIVRGHEDDLAVLRKVTAQPECR
jgi:hypothetical protein